jgi:hypothetical protein
MALSRRQELFEYCLDHVVRKIETLEVSMDPFPHFLLSGFFPDDVYSELLQRLPATEHYKKFDEDKHQGAKEKEKYRERAKLQMLEKNFAALGEEDQQFWLGVRDTLGCQTLKRAVFEKLACGLKLRCSLPAEEIGELPGYAMPTLFRETTGYSIKPHPDTRKKVVTMQIALPEDDSQEDIGTQFYRRSFNPATLLREPRGFHVSKTAPFLPNACYAFVVLNNIGLKSWHGRTTLESTDGIRNSILNIWHDRAEQANPEVVADHYDVARAA